MEERALASGLALSLILNLSTNWQCDLGQDADLLSEPGSPYLESETIPSTDCFSWHFPEADPKERSFWS